MLLLDEKNDLKQQIRVLANNWNKKYSTSMTIYNTN